MLSRRFSSVTNAVAALITVSTTPAAVPFLVETLALVEGFFEGFFPLLVLGRGVSFFDTGVFFCCTLLVLFLLPLLDFEETDPGTTGVCTKEEWV